MDVHGRLSSPSSAFRPWFPVPRTAAVVDTDGDDGDVTGKMRHLLGKVDVDRVEAALGHKFRERSFLLQAVTHCSYYLNKVQGNSLSLDGGFLTVRPIAVLTFST